METVTEIIIEYLILKVSWLRLVSKLEINIIIKSNERKIEKYDLASMWKFGLCTKKTLEFHTVILRFSFLLYQYNLFHTSQMFPHGLSPFVQDGIGWYVLVLY